MKSAQRRREPTARHAAVQAQRVPADAAQRALDQRSWETHRLTGDHAIYGCQCGYVFEAPVSTSVGCPHCGATQAW